MLNRQTKIELYYKTIRQKIHPKFFFPQSTVRKLPWYSLCILHSCHKQHHLKNSKEAGREQTSVNSMGCAWY